MPDMGHDSEKRLDRIFGESEHAPVELDQPVFGLTEEELVVLYNSDGDFVEEDDTPLAEWDDRPRDAFGVPVLPASLAKQIRRAKGHHS